jgi:ribosomal protein S18 acetylase RimI-like enzyme
LIVLAENVFNHTEDKPLRPLRIERDLPQLADLIEVAFKDDLERTGNPVVAEMRRLAKLGPLLWLVGGSHGLIPSLLDGFVWIADGELVGNVSLTRESGARGLWSISNVAVLPAFRRQGIARRLVEAAIGRAIERGAQRLALEVQVDNEAARQLYLTLGFVVYDTVHELQMPRIRWPGQVSPPELPLRPQRADDARALYDLARAATPGKAQEVKPIPLSRYQGGFDDRLSAWLGRLLGRSVRSAWVLEGTPSIAALLQTTARYHRDAHQLEILVHPDHRGSVEHALLEKGFHELGRFCPLDVKALASEDHRQALRAFEEAGFETVRALAQMTLDLRAIRHGVIL